MKKSSKLALLLVMWVLLPLSAGFGGHIQNAWGAEEQKSQGWEKGSPYNKLYNPDRLVKMKGKMEQLVEVIPMEGMAPGLAMVITTDKTGDKVTVHMGPKWFVDLLTKGFKKGDRVKIKGTWADIEGKKVLMALKVRNGEYFEVKFRKTKDGTPYWTMTPEEIIGSDERLED
jgi:hypothetical protein